MATVNVVLRKGQPKKDGTFPIIIRVTANRVVKNISTGYSVKENQFREGAENWVYRHDDMKFWNQRIWQQWSEIKKQTSDAELAGKQLNVNAIGKPAGGGEMFLKLVEAKLDDFDKKDKAGSYMKNQTRLRNLTEAWGGDDYQVAEVDKKAVTRYIDFRNDKKASNNTIKKDLSFFSGVLKRAEGFTGKNPFLVEQIDIDKVPTKKEKLTDEEITKLETTVLHGLNLVARDMFLFSFYCQGMRFADVAMITRSQIQKAGFEYTMSKTKKEIEIEMKPELRTIINRYINEKTPYLFPILKREIKDDWQKKSDMDSANALINTRLKRVAVICGIDKNLSTHIARHSFASQAYQGGTSIEDLMGALGHGDYQTTKVYLNELSPVKIKKAMRKFYSGRKTA